MQIKAEDPEKFAALQSPESLAIICKKEVRQAVAYAIDYDGITKAVLSGYGTPRTQHHPDRHCWAWIPPRCRAVIWTRPRRCWPQAGYPDGVTIDLYYASNATREYRGRQDPATTWPKRASPST